MNASISGVLLALGLVWGCGAGGNGSAESERTTAGGGASSSGVGGALGGTLPPQGSGAVAEPGEQAVPGAEQPFFGAEGTEPRVEQGRCQKVDFLYVVDNSASMVDEQESLARSFIGFSRIVEGTLGTTDHQIMVVDTDGSNVGDVLNGLTEGAGADACIGLLGAGLRTGSEGESCGLMGYQRYLLGAQPDAAHTFSCLAKVGTYGSADERPIEALLNATGSVRSGVADCNTGFLRDDAILVVTLITDEEDAQSDGDPESWKPSLLRAKHGDEKAVVMLGLISDTHLPGGLPGGPCDEISGTDSPRLQRFVESFELGSIGSACAPDYSEFFAEAVSSIDTACDVFAPIVR